MPSDYLSWDSKRRSKAEISLARHHRKLEVVWGFYNFLRTEGDIGLVTSGFFNAISEKRVGENGAVSWAMKLKTETSSNVRHPIVPTDEEVERVFDALGAHPNLFLAERNFLIGQVEARAGLRAMGAESLKLTSLDAMLEAEGIRSSGGSVGNLAHNKGEQVRVRMALSQLMARGRTVLPMPVVEKGGKKRDVEIPIDLARRLLDHVWGRRDGLIRRRRGAPRLHKGMLFVSWASGAPLTRGAIKDLVKDAFVTAKVRGSGHALRAHYLTSKAIELIEEARKKFGNNYDPEDIFHELAKLAGHRHRRTLYAYLDVARLREAALRELDE